MSTSTATATVSSAFVTLHNGFCNVHATVGGTKHVLGTGVVADTAADLQANWNNSLAGLPVQCTADDCERTDTVEVVVLGTDVNGEILDLRCEEHTPVEDGVREDPRDFDYADPFAA